MRRDIHASRKLRNLRRNLLGGLILGFLFCALPTASILNKGYIGGGMRFSGPFTRKATEPGLFYAKLGVILLPGIVFMVWSVRSYYRRKKNDL